MRLIKLFLLILMCNIISISFAASRIYQIDVVVFSHVTNKALLSENWPANPELPQFNKAIDLKPLAQATPNTLYQVLSNNRSKFNKEINALNKSGYHVLVSTTWLQPVLAPKNSKWIHLEGKGNVDINGIVKISRPYLFQVDADLILTIPQLLLQQIAPVVAKIGTTQFLLRQTASLRANQIYYFDHPLFGMLVKITPLNEKINEVDA